MGRANRRGRRLLCQSFVYRCKSRNYCWLSRAHPQDNGRRKQLGSGDERDWLLSGRSLVRRHRRRNGRGFRWYNPQKGGNAYTNSYANGYVYSNANSHVYSNANSHCNIYANANRYSSRNSNCHSYRYTYRNRYADVDTYNYSTPNSNAKACPAATATADSAAATIGLAG